MRALILASTSRYRRDLLARLHLPFEVHAPEVDETARPGETPLLGKPGTHERATQQLKQMSGQQVVFQTAVTVACQATGFEQTDLASVVVRFRHLPAQDIEFYLRTEQPYDCAGSAKCETLGIALLESIDSDDPTALVGLPLIRTNRLLRQAGRHRLLRGGSHLGS